MELARRHPRAAPGAPRELGRPLGGGEVDLGKAGVGVKAHPLAAVAGPAAVDRQAEPHAGGGQDQGAGQDPGEGRAAPGARGGEGDGQEEDAVERPRQAHDGQEGAGGGPAQEGPAPGRGPWRRGVRAGARCCPGLGVPVGERQRQRRQVHEEEVRVHPEDVGEGHRGEEEGGDPERRGGPQPPPEGERRRDAGERQQQGVGHQGAADRSEAHEGREEEGVEGGLAEGEAPALVTALEDQPLGEALPELDEPAVVPARVGEVPVPGQALGLHQVGGLVAHQAGPLPAVEGRRPHEGRREQHGEDAPGDEAHRGQICLRSQSRFARLYQCQERGRPQVKSSGTVTKR